MALYADTCVLLSLFFRDSGTHAALRWLDAANSDTIVVSGWTLTEFASSSGILARRGDISADLHRVANERFEQFVAARLAVECVSPADHERARNWLLDFRSGLRAGDALHLAVCARLGAQLCSADDALIRAAQEHKLVTYRLG